LAALAPGAGREHIVQVLGFFIGTPPVDPHTHLPPENPPSQRPAPATAVAGRTGPAARAPHHSRNPATLNGARH